MLIPDWLKTELHADIQNTAADRKGISIKKFYPLASLLAESFWRGYLFGEVLPQPQRAALKIYYILALHCCRTARGVLVRLLFICALRSYTPAVRSTAGDDLSANPRASRMDSDKAGAAMSGALETPTVNITAAAAWLPTLNTPSLKLPTPVLDGMGTNDWGSLPTQSAGAHGSLSGSGAGGLLSSGGPGGLGSGMSPRFMLESLRMSPGVSGSIAPNADAPKASNSSLAELFIVNEYSSGAVPAAAANSNSGAGAQGAPKSLPPLPAPGGSSTSAGLDTPQSQQQQHAPLSQSLAALPPKKPGASQLHSNHRHPEMHLRSPPGAAGRGMQHQVPPPCVLGTPSLPHGAGSSQAASSRALPSQAALHANAPIKQEGEVHSRDVGYAPTRNVAFSGGMPAGARMGGMQNALPEHGYGAQPVRSVGSEPPHRIGLGAGACAAAPNAVHAHPTRRNALSNAIEEAKANAQDRADKFAAKRKRSRQHVPDQEQPKESELLDEDKQLSPSELKKKRYSRRLELNRQSAAVSRVRRRAYVEELEGKLMYVEREKLSLEDQVAVMQTENHKLREQMRHLHEQLAGGRTFPQLPRGDSAK